MSNWMVIEKSLWEKQEKEKADLIKRIRDLERRLESAEGVANEKN